MRNILVIVILAFLVIIFMMGRGERSTKTINEGDGRVLPLERKETNSVMVNLSPDEFAEVDYEFDDRHNYRIRAAGDDIHLKLGFTDALSQHRHYEVEAVLREDKETHFWPWRITSVRAKSKGFLSVYRLEDGEENFQTRTYEASRYTKNFLFNPKVQFDRSKFEVRDMGIKFMSGDLWMIDSKESFDMTAKLGEESKWTIFIAKSRQSLCRSYDIAGPVEIFAPRGHGDLRVSMKLIAGFN